MRRAVLILPFLLACAKSETPAVDSMAAAAVMPAALTDADVAGTWKGTGTIEGTDSVFIHWTQVCGAGACIGTAEESKDTVHSTYTLSADSSVGKSAPYVEPSMGGARIVDNWVVRLSNGQAMGNGWMTLADKPDSVVLRYRIQGSRAQ